MACWARRPHPRNLERPERSWPTTIGKAWPSISDVLLLAKATTRRTIRGMVATPQNIAQELDRDYGGSMYRIFGCSPTGW